MGRVTLEGQTDHSGVRVSLYLSAQRDQKILDLNEKYPYIKTFISQGTEFDQWLSFLGKSNWRLCL